MCLAPVHSQHRTHTTQHKVPTTPHTLAAVSAEYYVGATGRSGPTVRSRDPGPRPEPRRSFRESGRSYCFKETTVRQRTLDRALLCLRPPPPSVSLGSETAANVWDVVVACAELRSVLCCKCTVPNIMYNYCILLQNTKIITFK